MRFHYQNLNERNGRTTGPIITHGRFWLGCFQCEWNLWSKRLALELGLADYEHALHFALCIYFFSLYLTLNNHRLESWIKQKTKRRDEKYGNGRTIGVRWFDGMLWIDLWNDPMEHRSVDPKWWHIAWCPRNWLFGYPQYSEKRLSTHRVEVPMPERAYPATVHILEASWSRSRWPWPKKIIRADIQPDIPIPHPGKGENSWDCGEDATYSMTCSAETPLEAVQAITNSVLRSRHKYGGPMWRPEKTNA
jgi:hypothetical protein